VSGRSLSPWWTLARGGVDVKDARLGIVGTKVSTKGRASWLESGAATTTEGK